MNKKNYLYFVIAFAVVIVAAIVLTNRGNGPDNDLDILTSLSPSASPESSPIPTPTSKPVQTIKPTPGLIIEEIKTYEQLTEEFDKEGRWLALNDSCTEIVPSNITYHNNTQIMLDNTASANRRILHIGDREYLLEAGEWFLMTLSSPTLPARLPIFCGTIELGSIDLVQ